jgi:hypothetical protein
MFFNFKESVRKTKQSQLNYEIERVNARFANSLPRKIKFNTDLPRMELNENVVIPKIHVTDYEMFLNVVETQHISQDKHVAYIKNNIIKIANVYQQIYSNFKKATGFGDFIRGSYFTIQFCERYNIEYDIVINHPIKKYLKLQSNKFECGSYCEPNLLVNAFDNPNFHKDNSEKSKNEEIIDDFCSYLQEPNNTFENRIANVYTISFPFETITDQHRAVMRKYLEPSDSFKLFILNLIKSARLTIKQYIVIHIRSGDNSLIYNQDVNEEYFAKIIIEIYKIYSPRYEYLLLSDSIKLKEKILHIFPKIRATFKEIAHFGEGVELSDEAIKNTMMDFYLMTYSGKIFSYSCYDHGTGFSRWCAETFNIPYKCSFVN